jgi:hypothetical protein
MRSRGGVLAGRIALVLFGAALGLAAIEAALRLLGCERFARHSRQSAPFLAVNPYWGVWHYPNHLVDHEETCFRAHYRTNSFGMKGPEVRAGTTRIALLGDSFVEGWGNDNDASLDRVMEPLLGDRYEVLNFGVSGGFSTLDELALYGDFARHFRPSLVVLFFTNYNDLQENLQSANDRWIAGDPGLAPRRARFEDVVSFVRDQRPGTREAWTPRRSCLRYLYGFAERAVRLRMQGILNFRWDFRSELARVYQPEEDADIARAWEIVEAALRRLQALTRREGATLVVADIGDPYQLDPNWLRASSARFGPLDPTWPNRRLAEICRRSGILFHDSYPEAKRYIEERGLRFPYLSFSCDRHYDREGQELLARSLVGFLRAKGLVAP